MSRELALLFVGSTAETRQLVVEILSDSHYEVSLHHVRNADDMCAVLNEHPVDLILCEQCAAPGAIAECTQNLSASGRDIPVVVLSESDDARAAVQALKAGAADWVITHHLSERLLPAIEHALSDVESRRERNAIAAQLEESRHRYHELAEALPQGVYELDLKGRFTFVNQRGLDLFGYTREDLERHPHVVTVLAEEDRDRAMQRIESMLAGSVPDDGAEYSIVSGDGTLRPVLVHAAPITQGDRIVGVRGVVTDLREIRETRQRLRRSEERYRRLVETMGDGLLTVDRDGTISYANRAMAEILEAPVDRLIGGDVRGLLDAENSAIIEQQLERRFSEGMSGAYELEAETGSGARVTLMITATPLRDDEGSVIASLAVVTDVTRQRRVEAELRRVKTAVDNSSDGIAVADADYVPIYINPAFVEISGYTLQELQKAGGAGATFADEEEYHRVFNEIKEKGSFVGEFEGRHASGRNFPVMGRIDFVRDEQGEVTGLVAVGTDITQRRQAEERRRSVRARLTLINRLNQMLNAGESIDDIIAAGADGLREMLDAHHVHLFMRQRSEDGEELVLRYSNLPPQIVYKAFGQVHEPQQMVLPLRPDAQVWEIYQTGELMEIREPDLERTMSDIKQWAEPSPVRSGMDIAHDLGVRYLCLMPLIHGDKAMGHVTVSRTEDTPLNDTEKGVLEGFAQQMAVILDKARTEGEITRLNQFLESIIDNAAVWFSVIDEDQNLLIWNRAAEEISGYSRDQIESSRHLMRLLYPDEERRKQAYSHLGGAFSGHLQEEEFETSITRADGDECRIAWNLRTLDAGAKGTGLVVIGRDVTESHELQEQLQRVQRMDAVGTLAGGIAHDFNNVLTAIIGHAELLEDESEEGSSAQWHADQISQNAERASRLTRQLLAFSRKQPSEPQVVNLNRLVLGMEEMFRRVMPDDINLQLDLSSDLGYTEIDPSQVEQIVMNLVLNARDAMPHGGQVQVRTANASLSDDSLSELFDAQPGEYVTLEVVDTGVGMDEETESRIFEPFFTTKQKSGGTGLGLSTVYGLVRQSKGAISVYSEVGKGSLFRIYLPRVDVASGKQRRTAHTEQTDLRGNETMLVVEDADNLRDLIGTILSLFGYTVYSAATGDDALSLEQEHRGEIDLVVTDVVMPEMSGTELADRLLEVSPGLKILFISGYPTDRAISAGRTDGRFSFLQKPFSATELGRKIREMID